MATPTTYNLARDRRSLSWMTVVATSLALVFAILVAPSAAHATTTLPQTQSVSPGRSTVTALNDATADKAAAAFKVDAAALSSSGSAYVGVRVRPIGDTYYLLQARVTASGGVFIALKRSIAGRTTDLVASSETNLKASPGSAISISLEARGANTVALVGHVKVGAASVPVNFQDSSAARILTGGKGVAWGYVSARAPGAVAIVTGAYDQVQEALPPANKFVLNPSESKVVRISLASDVVESRFEVTQRNGGSSYVGVRVRVKGNDFYLLQARITPERKVLIALKRSASGVISDLKPTHDTGIVLAPDEKLVLSLKASGSTTVSLEGQARAEKTGPQVHMAANDASKAKLSGTAGTHAWAYAGAGSGAATISQTTLGESTITPSPNPTVPPTPTTPPQPTPSPTAEPSPAPQPPVGPAPEFPTAATTGVPEGTVLRVHEGDLVVKTPGAVVDGLEVRGFIVIAAPDVTIKNTRIVGRDISVPAFLVTNHNSGQKFTIVDSEIIPKKPSPYMNGIMGKNFVAERLNIHGVIDGVRITGSDVRVSDSWIHDNLHYVSDPNFNGSPSHDDSIQIQAGHNIVLSGNRTEGAWNASVQVTQGLGLVSNLTISGNFMQDGSCTINISENGAGSPVPGVAVRDNTFGSDRRIKSCAVYGPPTTKIAISGNKWADGSNTAFVQNWW